MLEEQRKLGAKLKKLRKAARLNQEQVEERTGLPTRTLSSLENAHHAAGLASLVACAVAYGVSLRDLFDD